MGEPERTCVSCRTRAPRTRLLRFVADQRGHLRLDGLRRARGRGAYVCPTAACVDEAVRRAAFARSLRRNVARVDGLARQAQAELRARAQELVEQAKRDGRTDRSAAGGVTDGRLARLLEGLNEQVRSLES
jgi:predicted RNA-binding protein YlxR (DUF448 family)